MTKVLWISAGVYGLLSVASVYERQIVDGMTLAFLMAAVVFLCAAVRMRKIEKWGRRHDLPVRRFWA